MSEMITVPKSALRELTKWAYAAAHFDGMVGISHLSSINPAVKECLAEVEARNAQRESSDHPWVDFPNGFADV